MTGENRRKNIVIEISRGEDALDSARILLEAGKYADSVSRAYYGALHHARALLLTLEAEPRTHAGVQRLLHRDFVREGTFPPEIAQLLSSLEKFRLDADYSAEVVFTAPTAREELAAAERFIAEVRGHLQARGWIEQT